MFCGLETISHHAPQSWKILPEEFKQRNTISLFKNDGRQRICNECPCRLCKVFVPNLGFILGTATNLVLNIHHTFSNASVCMYVCVCVCVYMCMCIYMYVCIYIWYVSIYIYIYTSRLAGKYMFSCEYIGICCYLTCISQHLPILSISTFSFY